MSTSSKVAKREEKEMIKHTTIQHLLLVSILLLVLIAAAPTLAMAGPPTGNGRSLSPTTQFYVPPPDKGALKQIAQLTSKGDKAAAMLIRSMINLPQAVWFNGGTAKQVQQAVQTTVLLAEAKQRGAGKSTVPVLVAYNVPGRDCSQYSKGGAATGDAYKAWIRGFAAGLGNHKAIVILEPDGLALLPTDCGQPDTYDRVSLINYAAHTLLKDPNALIYLDAGHSAWHNVADMSTRLVQAGVKDVQGFFLNISNYQYTSNVTHYGNWISACITYATVVSPGNYSCPDQYWNGGPPNWTGVALSPYGEWSDTATEQDLNTSGENTRYANMLGSTAPTTHFVIDTSRNSVGPWPGISGHPASDSATQDWCNPPDRGLGLRPTANTGQPLVDAYLWVKTPGESDGQCYRWTGGPTDPVRNTLDPAAGQWFADMALELVHNATPPLH